MRRRSRSTPGPISPHYLEQFESRATANGCGALGARGAEHNQIVFDLLSSTARGTLVKRQTMLTDEFAMPAFLEQRGVAVIETDLGERIQQLDK